MRIFYMTTSCVRLPGLQLIHMAFFFIHSFQFRCKDHRCIFRTRVCNGQPDCVDKSDEQNCTSPEIPCPVGLCRFLHPIRRLSYFAYNFPFLLQSKYLQLKFPGVSWSRIEISCCITKSFSELSNIEINHLWMFA